MELLYQYKGLIGCNLPCDLHMEHLNRRLKKIVCSMGANVTPEAIVKAEKALGPVEHICQLFEEQTSNTTVYNSHLIPSFGKRLEYSSTNTYYRRKFLSQHQDGHTSHSMPTFLS